MLRPTISTLFPYTTLFRSAFITTGILISFFYYNVFGASKRRRRIFMGDTGSMTLGYTMAFLAISFAMNNKSIKDRKSTRLNSSHVKISYAVFCLKKKNKQQ